MKRLGYSSYLKSSPARKTQDLPLVERRGEVRVDTLFGNSTIFMFILNAQGHAIAIAARPYRGAGPLGTAALRTVQRRSALTSTS